MELWVAKLMAFFLLLRLLKWSPVTIVESSSLS